MSATHDAEGARVSPRHLGGTHTVDVMSDEHTSQTYLTPPSPPLVTVFLRMTPISRRRRGVGLVGAGTRPRSLQELMTSAQGATEAQNRGEQGGPRPLSAMRRVF